MGDFWKLRRYALLPSDPLHDRTASAPTDAACARLGPVANRTDPVFFAVETDQPVRAYFAMRALDLAQRDVAGFPITCKSDQTLRPICLDKVAGLKALRLREVGAVSVSPCSGNHGTCVEARWIVSRQGNTAHGVTVTVRTNSETVDPPPASVQASSVSIIEDTAIED